MSNIQVGDDWYPDIAVFSFTIIGNVVKIYQYHWAVREFLEEENIAEKHKKMISPTAVMMKKDDSRFTMLLLKFKGRQNKS